MATSNIRRSVKRYKASNPYSFRLFFGFIDSFIGTFKIVVVLLALAACWKGFLTWYQSKDVDALAGADVEQAAPVVLINSLSPVSSAAAVLPIESLVNIGEANLSGALVTEAVLFDEAWLMSLDRDKFTVQLGTSLELDKLVAFAREVFVNEHAHIFPIRVSSIGNPIYGLAFGEHADLQAAQEAVARFPAAYRQNDPWIRPVGQLQDQVQNTKNNLGL